MKLTNETLKRIIKEELEAVMKEADLEEIRQSQLGANEFGPLILNHPPAPQGHPLVGSDNPVELEIFIKKAIEDGLLPKDIEVDMSVVDKAVYLKPSTFPTPRQQRLGQRPGGYTAHRKEQESLVALLKKLGLNVKRGAIEI